MAKRPKHYRAGLTPPERRAVVEQLFKGANPLRMMEEYGIGYQTLNDTVNKWKQYIKLKKYFFHEYEQDPY